MNSQSYLLNCSSFLPPICNMSECKSAEIVGSIDDTLTLILLCLPVKSLIRFKSVSKEWFSLITNPNFCNLRSQKTNPAIGVYFKTSCNKPPYEYIPFSLQKPRNAPSINREDPSGSFVLQSCNGLMLCCSGCPIEKFYVYNPTTNRKTVIPESRSRILSGTMLAFDPAKSPHYKLVFVGWVGISYGIQIYSSETGDWRIGGEIEGYRSNVDFANGVYWNGSIHWISLLSVENSLRFHIGTQVFDEMPTPPYRSVLYWACYFGESCDHLHYIQPGPQFIVYEMKRDYSEWFAKYRIDFSPVIIAHPEMIRMQNLRYFSILSLVRGEKEEDSILVLLIPGKAIKYNLVDGRFEKLCEFDDSTVDAKGLQYIESLSCV